MIRSRVDAGRRRRDQTDPQPGDRPSRPATLRRMARPVLAVIFGTFTLRLATGSRARCSSTTTPRSPSTAASRSTRGTVGVLGALFYATRARPLADVRRPVGPRRPPADHAASARRFGAVAVIITAFTVSLPVIGFTRLLEGASTAASVPVDPRVHRLRHRRRRAAAGQGRRPVRGRDPGRADGRVRRSPGRCSPAFGPDGVPAQRARVRRLVRDLPARASRATPSPSPPAAPTTPTEGLRRYVRILRGSHVWLLAPTWIAINADARPVHEPDAVPAGPRARPRVREPAADGRLRPAPGQRRAWRSAGCCSSPACSTGAASSGRMRRTSIIVYGIVGGAVMLAAVAAINHAAGRPVAAAARAGRRSRRRACSSSPGATPAAIGLLADMTEAYPDDRGAIMGLYSVFLGLGQIFGSLVGGVAAQRGGPRRDLRRVVRAARRSRCCRSAGCAGTSTGSARAGAARRPRRPGADA